MGRVAQILPRNRFKSNTYTKSLLRPDIFRCLLHCCLMKQASFHVILTCAATSQCSVATVAQLVQLDGAVFAQFVRNLAASWDYCDCLSVNAVVQFVRHRGADCNLRALREQNMDPCAG